MNGTKAKILKTKRSMVYLLKKAKQYLSTKMPFFLMTQTIQMKNTGLYFLA